MNDNEPGYGRIWAEPSHRADPFYGQPVIQAAAAVVEVVQVVLESN